MNRYMLILSRRIPVIKKAHVSNVYIEKGNWSRQLNKHIAHNSVFMAQMYLKLSPIYVNWYILLKILQYVATLCFILCFDLLWHWTVVEAQCCMLLSLFTIVYNRLRCTSQYFHSFQIPHVFLYQPLRTDHSVIEYNAHKVDREVYHVFNWTVFISPAASQWVVLTSDDKAIKHIPRYSQFLCPSLRTSFIYMFFKK